MAQAKEKIKLIENKKAEVKQSQHMQQMMMLLNDSSAEASQELLTQTNIMTAHLSSPTSPKVDEIQNAMNLTMTPKEHVNSGGVTVRSMPDTAVGVNSALGMSGMKPDHRLHNNHNNNNG